MKRIFGSVRLEDFGRPGYRRFGVPPGGSFDRQAMVMANSLVGNVDHLPVLELTLADVLFEALQPSYLSLVSPDKAVSIRIEGGEELHVPIPDVGARTYVGILGGFAGEKVLGSVSGQLVRTGDILSSGESKGKGGSPRNQTIEPSDGRIRVAPGPQSGRFDFASLRYRSYRVSLQSDRAGILLEGEPWGATNESLSEPACVGAIQVNNSGQLMILGPDGPTIGGYPKIAVVRNPSLRRVAQLRPGDVVQFEID